MQTSTNQHNTKQKNFKSIGQPLLGEKLIWQREDEKKSMLIVATTFIMQPPRAAKTLHFTNACFKYFSSMVFNVLILELVSVLLNYSR